MQHLHGSHAASIFLITIDVSSETSGAVERRYSAGLGWFFLAIPGGLPGCMEMQSGFLYKHNETKRQAGLETSGAFLYDVISSLAQPRNAFPPEKIPWTNAASVGPIFLFPGFAWDR
ncbi:hypothetical protein MESS2_330055 [Mesorhizobium metallidurans STM 2683]|uniref:Uncharacterized protein n=1 Tax=Mesorhizobium metallidurans STM 2683 TaxID=1297569 RepID=M5F3Z7_9HYPH|nr:hypothetical protein [Mesorhizobium metallidurans]CCV06596.1 hypothetical protein MESS2_330055 [Mesorhizobium metallidurans STM 2683]